jgi:hypothetical protein
MTDVDVDELRMMAELKRQPGEYRDDCLAELLTMAANEIERLRAIRAGAILACDKAMETIMRHRSEETHDRR